MHSGLGFGMGKFRHILVRVGKGVQVWMSQIDRAGIDDISRSR